jgi:hypothetical protein
LDDIRLLGSITAPKQKEEQMDKITKQYRKGQFDKVNTEHSEYKPKIKIIKPNGETNWMDITEAELLKIRALLVY